MPSKELVAQETGAELETAPRGASLGIRISVTAIAIILACIDFVAAQDCSGGSREVAEGWLYRVYDEQRARDFGCDVQVAALRPGQ